MAEHAFHITARAAPGEILTVEGDEAAHAGRVKRLRQGERVLAFDGRGHRIVAEVVEAKRSLVLRVLEAHDDPPHAPAVHVLSATPKGPRVGDLVDALSQVGAASWTPLSTERGGVEPSVRKAARLERIAVEAMKQCRRSWTLEVHEPVRFADALRAPEHECIIVADASGAPLAPRSLRGASSARILVGPEGGWTSRELDEARAAGAAVASFGVHILRIENAAPVAAAVVLHLFRILLGDPGKARR